ncbi:MAG TPA: serine/threonine-protein kinase [Gemmataceae bacterium]|nr:serine/threonine-protein kinase [Gemmataceae bacterium]
MTRTASTDAFLDVLRNSKLLAEQRLADYLEQSPGLPASPKAAAQQLVRDGLLTAFQAEQILAGRYKGFFLLGGQYKVLKPIGRGGMGTVFLCEHLQLNRRVAVKILPKEQARDKVALERFQREARAAAALDHPNIVRVYDVSAAPALLVMEYAEGKDLQEILDHQGPVPYRKAVGYVVQAAAGLQHAHERGIIHRDVKPGNLLLDRSGVVKILDMGLARFLDKDDRLTQNFDGGSVLGTADYISPEQAIASSEVDGRTDVYSLGVTLYTLICGRTPFGGSAAQKLIAHQVRKAVPAHKVRPEVPEGLSAVIARMMAKDPNRRYASAAEALTALAPFIDAAPPDGSGVRLPPTAPHSRRPLLIGGGVGLALVVIALVLAVVSGRQSPNASAGSVAAAPPNDPPAAVPPVKTPPAQPARPAAPRPAEKVLYRLNLEEQQPFLSRIENKQNSGDAQFPESWSGLCWKEESVAEVLAERVAGSMALGYRNLSGDPTCQLLTSLGGAVSSMEQGRQYVLRLEYQGQKEANAMVYVRRGDSSSFASAKLRPTGGRWEVVEIPISQEAELARDIAFCTSANGPQTTVFIRSAVLVERPKASD